jgi:hypothetical protein
MFDLVTLLNAMTNHLGRQRHVRIQRDWLNAGVLQVDLVNVSEYVFVSVWCYKNSFHK